jgi:lysophospholipase L1-like esterase
MKILFYGDSITDAGRVRDLDVPNKQLGCGYVAYVANQLLERSLTDYDVINTGISGNRIVDLYARIKVDCWNRKPDVLSIHIGINDVWHEVQRSNGVELDRFENVYRMLIKDTIAALPDVKIIICEPFVLRGSATDERYEEFFEVKKYAKVAKKLAEEFSLTFVPLQDAMDAAGEKYGNDNILSDGVHPTMKGAVIFGNEWLKAFDGIFR